MTGMDKQRDQSRLDHNLDRLLGLGEPAPRMPEHLKSRIRSRLDEVEEGSGRQNILPGRWVVWPLVATAALALLFIVFRNGGSPETIVWADVQQQLSQVHSIALKACTDISETTGKRMNKCNKVYYEDPGLSRAEEYAPNTSPGSVEGRPVKILVTRREPGSSERLTLYPESGRVELSAGIFLSTGPEPPSQVPMDLASFNWKLMEEIAADKTRRIGNRVINGVPAVGFEFEMPDLVYINPDRVRGKYRYGIRSGRNPGDRRGRAGTVGRNRRRGRGDPGRTDYPSRFRYSALSENHHRTDSGGHATVA
jgi:hypothetical protein